jgi:hypothetical protein
MTTPSDTVRSLLRRLGVAGPARLDVSRGTRAPSANTTSASKIRLLLTLTATAAFFAFPGMASAATPLETPEKVEVTAVSTTTATVSGVLAPKAAGAGEAGSYFFLYGVAAPGECGSERLVSEGPGGMAVEELGIAAGLPKEKKEVHLTGLHPDTKYTVCLFERNSSESEQVESVPVAFETKTPIHLETPVDLQAKSIGATEATLSGVLNPGAERKAEPGSYEFVYRPSALNVCQGEGEQATTPVKALGAKEEPAGPTKIEGLSPGTRYAYCLRVHNETGEEALSPASTFTTTPLAPSIEPESESASEVSASSARVSANAIPGGPETLYRVTVEYGPTVAYGSTVTLPEGEAGAGVTEVHPEAQLEDLTPGTTYHYRFVIENSASPAGVPGADQTFTTQTAGTAFMLPDNRGYEMVTPPQKHGAQFKHTGAIRAAASGDAIADIASQPIEGDPEGNANEVLSVLSTRTPTGWASRSIAAPHLATGEAIGATDQGEYALFSEDLSSALVESVTGSFEKLSPQATEQTPYLRTNYLNGNPSEPCQALDTSAASCYAPLVSESNDTYVPLIPFGGGCAAFGYCGPEILAATHDLSHIVLDSSVPLTRTSHATSAGGGVFASEEKPNVYEYSAGELQLVSLLPGQTEGKAGLQLAGRQALNGYDERGEVAARQAISKDGTRVILEEIRDDPEEPPYTKRSGLYLRDVAKGETIRLDEPEPQCLAESKCEASFEPEYMGANSDDSRIFFLDGAKLTPNSGATRNKTFMPSSGNKEEKPDLYECGVVETAGKDHCELRDLTPRGESGESAKVAEVLGVSEDGSYIYFAAGGGLGAAAPGACFDPNEPFYEGNNSTGEDILPTGTLCNVFVRHLNSETGVWEPPRLVARLSQLDAAAWNPGGLRGSSVRVSPNGRYLAFRSQRGLTGYDSRDRSTNKPDSEIYVYDSAAGTLNCASCDPAGTRPSGEASVPGWPVTVHDEDNAWAFYQPRYLTNEGRLFFNSPDALVTLDVSKQSEVYEYEPQGVPAGSEHGCSVGAQSGSEVFKPAREYGVEALRGREVAACVALISTGTAGEGGSQFLEASETGADVFFLTSQKVLPQDVDTSADVYDAHECTSESPCITPAVAPRQCETEASCKAPPTPQPTIYAAPATATFSGPGNLISPPPAVVAKPKPKVTKCKKGDTKNKKGRCVKNKKKKKTKAKKSSRATNDRRAR